MSARDPSTLQADLIVHDELATDPVSPRPALRASLLRSIGRESALGGFAERVATFFDLPAARGLELARLAARADEAPWVDGQASGLLPFAGVRLLHFEGGPRVAEADCGLVSVAPGVRFAEHSHAGEEWSLVLAGSAEEEGTGVVWRAGDVVHRAAGSAHAFTITSREPFVFAVVLDDRIRFSGR
jgi:quercetin dioxygenase-like cupin family protein